MTRLLIVLAVVAVVVAARPALAALRQRDDRAPLPDDRLAEFAVRGVDRTWLVFTTPFCASCGPVMDELRATFPGDAVVGLDAVEHGELIQALGVRRSPTVFEVDASGRVLDRLIGAEAARSRMAAATVG